MEEAKTYLIFDKISPKLRGTLSVALILTGYLFQVETRNILTGFPFIILCLVFNLLKSIAIKQESAADFKWEEVTPGKINDVYNHCVKLKRFQGTNVGCIVMVVLIIFMVSLGGPIFGLLSSIAPNMYPFTALIIDSVILFTGLVVTGNRSAWTPAGLLQKTEIVRRILEMPALKNDPTIKMVPLLEMGSAKKGSFPNDVRVMMRFKDAPADFIGLQAQISINTVKSTPYPYFYIVLIAKPEFGLIQKCKDPGLNNITIENEETGEVDVVIIRQTTSKTSGYHTNGSVQDYILDTSIRIAKLMIGTK